MSNLPRRTFLMGAGSALGLTAACANRGNSRGADTIDSRANTALNFLYARHPDTIQLSRKAAGVLVMPLVTKASFLFGGAYGRGALRVGEATVDYYSSMSGSVGLQVGAQQFSHVLFFMTPKALEDFRLSPGWSVGADMDYAYNDSAGNLTISSTTLRSPVVAVIFDQAGLGAGATLQGTKYTRINP